MAQPAAHDHNQPLVLGCADSTRSVLTIPVLASGGASGPLSKNFRAMCEEVADSVTDHLVPDCGHWVAEEQPTYFTEMFCEFDGAARA